jgi:flagellar basal body-associated protein FliL
MVTQLIQRKMKLGKYIIDFLIILSIVVAGLCFYFFYMYATESIKAMKKDPKVIEYDSLRRKHFNLK